MFEGAFVGLIIGIIIHINNIKKSITEDDEIEPYVRRDGYCRRKYSKESVAEKMSKSIRK